MTSRWSIRAKLILIVVMVASLTLALAIFITLQSTASVIRSERVEQKRIESQGYARLLSQQFATIAARPRALAQILSDPAITPIPTIWGTVTNMLRDQTLIERVGILRPYREGYQQIIFRRPVPGSNTAPMHDDYLPAWPDTLWLPQTLAPGELYWGQITRASGAVVRYTAAIPYTAAAPSGGGVLWMELNATAVRTLIQNTVDATPGEDYHVVASDDGIMAAFGLPMAMADRTGALLRPADAAPLMTQMAAMPTQTDAVEMPDPMALDTFSDSLVVRTPITGTQWNLLSVYEPAALSAPQNQAGFFAVVLGAVGLVTLALAVRGTVRTLVSEPLTRIAAAAQEIGSGDMRYHVDYTERTDEVGELARALATMQSNLTDTYGRMSEYGRSLERRVGERTQELEQARELAMNNASELRMLYDASIDLVSEYQLDVMLQKLINYTRTLLRAGYSSVWMLSEDGRQLRLVATTNDHRHVVGVVVPSNEGLAGRVVRTRKPLLVDDYTNWSGRIGWIMPQMHRGLAVPLIYSGKAIGAVVTGRGPLDRKFDESDQRLLNLLANVVSPIIRNAQLFMQVEEAKKKTEVANEVKTRFLASITHELRTPLNLVINNMDFMRIGVFGEVNEEQVARLDQTIRSAEDLLYLINDLLDVSKIEAGEMQLFIQPTDLYPVLVDTLDAAVALIPDNSMVPLLTDFPESLPSVSMDARRIRQVLLNLLSNAIKFTRQGEIVFRVRVQPDRVEFSVSDTGMGIPKEDLDMIFRPFERSRTAQNNGVEGTGLGLAISRFLVEAHGGTLEVDTEIGKGSTFRFALPLHPPEAQRTLTVRAAVV